MFQTCESCSETELKHIHSKGARINSYLLYLYTILKASWFLKFYSFCCQFSLFVISRFVCFNYCVYKKILLLHSKVWLFITSVTQPQMAKLLISSKCASDTTDLFSQHSHICKDAFCLSGANRMLTDLFNTLCSFRKQSLI